MSVLKIILMFFSISTPVFSEIVEIEGTGITFDAPAGFSPVPQEFIDIKWPNKNAPRFVLGNERATTTIAYDLKSQDLSNTDMEEIRAYLEAFLSRAIPGIKWKQNKVIELQGKDWVFLEMTSNAIDTDIYNIMMLTGFDDKMIIFNFNSTQEDFPKYENVLRKSIESIRLPVRKNKE